MGRITGLERPQEVPSKVMLLYEAVTELIAEDADVNAISVSTITERAGIGKGTAYEYFDSKEDILVCAVIFYVQQAYEKVERVLETRESFSEQVRALLDAMTETDSQKCSIVHYVHLMTDHSSIGRLAMSRMKEEPLRQYMPDAVFGRLLQKAAARGEVRADLPMDYMVCSLMSRFMAYMMCISEKSPIRMDSGQVLPYLYQSILQELCEKNM